MSLRSRRTKKRRGQRRPSRRISSRDRSHPSRRIASRDRSHPSRSRARYRATLDCSKVTCDPTGRPGVFDCTSDEFSKDKVYSVTVRDNLTQEPLERLETLIGAAQAQRRLQETPQGSDALHEALESSKKVKELLDLPSPELGKRFSNNEVEAIIGDIASPYTKELITTASIPNSQEAPETGPPPAPETGPPPAPETGPPSQTVATLHSLRAIENQLEPKSYASRTSNPPAARQSGRRDTAGPGATRASVAGSKGTAGRDGSARTKVATRGKRTVYQTKRGQ